ncbi:MAG TPA: hypothetical protein VJA21_19560 [Verrucomicrobiae bacterium]
MNDRLNRLSRHVCSKLRTLGFSSPREAVVNSLLKAALFASLKTEEGRFLRGSLTFADPKNPDIDIPPCRRADYPSFTPLGHRMPLHTGALAKLFRAVDRWSGSIAVYGTPGKKLFVWEVVDQLVQHNVHLNRESPTGFAAPGVITVNIEGIADISVYHGILFLGRVTQDTLSTTESDALSSEIVAERVIPELEPVADRIALALNSEEFEGDVRPRLLEAWRSTVSRICIGLRRLGIGGSLLITPRPLRENLEVVHPFRYTRMGDSTALSVLDELYHEGTQWSKPGFPQEASPEYAAELGWAQADAEDRASELTAAIKLVTSLATADGLVLMDRLLRVRGFGVKITIGTRLPPIYDGQDFSHRGTGARKIDASQFGTRHGSMLRYCHADPEAIGVVISQDGHVRVISSSGSRLLLWQNVRLLSHDQGVAAYARQMRGWRKALIRNPVPRTLGFTAVPKTMRALLALRRK